MNLDTDIVAEQEVRAALGADPATAALADVVLTVEPGGLSNRAWIAACAGDKYFVRLSPSDAARLGVDRRSECTLLALVAHAGLAPDVVRCDPARRLLVTRHVEGHTLACDEAVAPRNLARVGRALQRLHRLPVPSGMRRVDFAAQARHLESECVGGAAIDPGLRSSAQAAFAALESGGRADTLCHNDLHHLNLVDGGERLWLVDWEYGGAGDPAIDIASFLCQHDCGPGERQALMAAYGDDMAAVQLDAACRAFEYVQWLWYRAWPAGEGADPIYAERAAAIEQRLRATRPA